MKEYFLRAIRNVQSFGDTDVFPFPFENLVFADSVNETIDELLRIDSDLDAALAETPPANQSLLSAVGYGGFRWATQIDPIWNLYFLGLVLSIAEEIEKARLPRDREVVFSYRYSWDETSATIFARDSVWRDFQMRALNLAKGSGFVVSCDISDFYPRIYHHRLENALQTACPGSAVPGKITKTLKAFSNNVSYGLPVGGPASRLLSELLLNRVDRLLSTDGARFCRFADDYRLFGTTMEDAYKALLFLSTKLHENEGLLIQKSKTQIQPATEFVSGSSYMMESEESEAAGGDERALFKLRLHFDPYSPTADEDYEALREQIQKLDILGILGRELRKSRIDIALARRLVAALKFLGQGQREASVLSLIENLSLLYPVFPQLAIALKELLPDASDTVREKAFGELRALVITGSHIAMVPTNLSYLVRLLAYDPSEEAEGVLQSIYSNVDELTIRRDVVLAMARRGASYWISDCLKRFGIRSPWERRALIHSSFILGDEGAHFRRASKDTYSEVEKLVAAWSSAKKQQGGWELPL